MSQAGRRRGGHLDILRIPVRCMMLTLLKRWKLDNLHLIMCRVAVLFLDRVDPFMNLVDVMPTLSFWVNRTFLSVPDLSVPDHLKRIIAPVFWCDGRWNIRRIRIVGSLGFSQWG
jgi:hypothetical protein